MARELQTFQPMKNRTSVHIVPHPGGWAVKVSGSATPQSVNATQAQAQRAGRPLAQALKTELVPHRRDGKIRDSDSYGNDPFPPRDRKH